MASNDTHQLMESFYENPQNMFAAITDSTEWHEMKGVAYGGLYIGKAAIMENVFSRIGADWKGFRATANDIIAAGDKATVLGVYSGTHRETGKTMEAEFAHVYTLEDGKVVKFQQYVDSALFNASMT